MKILLYIVLAAAIFGAGFFGYRYWSSKTRFDNAVAAGIEYECYQRIHRTSPEAGREDGLTVAEIQANTLMTQQQGDAIAQDRGFASAQDMTVYLDTQSDTVRQQYETKVSAGIAATCPAS